MPAARAAAAKVAPEWTKETIVSSTALVSEGLPGGRPRLRPPGAVVIASGGSSDWTIRLRFVAIYSSPVSRYD